MKTILSFLLLAQFHLAAAQGKADTLSYEQVAQLTGKLRPSVTKYLQLYSDSLGNITRVNSVRTRMVKESAEHPGKVLIIQKYNSSKGENTDTAIVDKRSFRPAAYLTNIATEGYREKVSFENNKVSANTTYKDSTATSVNDLINNYFLATTTVDLISLLPLKDNYQVFLKSVNAGTRFSNSIVEIKVTGTEKLKLPTGDLIDVYRISVGFPASKSYSDYWFSVNSHVMVKHVFNMPRGNVFSETLQLD